MFAAEVQRLSYESRNIEILLYLLISLKYFAQLILKSKTIYFAQGSIIADRHEAAKGLMVITSGCVNVELPMDSEEADEENRSKTGLTHLYVLSRGCALPSKFLKQSIFWNNLSDDTIYNVQGFSGWQCCGRG